MGWGFLWPPEGVATHSHDAIPRPLPLAPAEDCPIYLIRYGSPNWWRFVTGATCHRFSVRDISAIECRPPYLYECFWEYCYIHLFRLFISFVCGSSRPVTNRHTISPWWAPGHTFWRPVTDRVYWIRMEASVPKPSHDVSSQPAPLTSGPSYIAQRGCNPLPWRHPQTHFHDVSPDPLPWLQPREC